MWKCYSVPELLEFYFDRHGRFVAKQPMLVIFLCIGATAMGLFGILTFEWETNAMKLWIPQDSDFALNYQYLWETHPPDTRFHSVIFTTESGENILQPKYIRQMYEVRKRMETPLSTNETWTDFCFRVPVVSVSLNTILQFGEGKRKRREETFFDNDFQDNFKDFDPSVENYPEPYCTIIESLDTTCYESSILELWANNGRYDSISDKLIEDLSIETVLSVINTRNTSGLTMIEKNFTSLLGGVEIDEDGQITSAKVAMFNFFGKMNVSAAKLETMGVNNAVGEYVDKGTLMIEKHLINILSNKSYFSHGFDLQFKIARSFNDIASATIFADVYLVFIGFSIVFTYVCYMLGKMSCVENRMWLTFAGLLSIPMAIAISYGLCSTMGFTYSPLHNFIPFLLTGLGIDDMFVIMQCWSNLEYENPPRSQGNAPVKSQLDVPSKFAKTMKNAGVAITVTSFTDFIAFLVGASTILPALRSFCVFCGFGILFVYALQSTWFVAWMVFDEERISKNYNAYLPWIKHTIVSHGIEEVAEQPATPKERSFLQKSFDYYGRLVELVPFKIFVIVITLGLAGVSIWGNILLQQKFDPMWFLPPDSYLSKWATLKETYFPQETEWMHVFLFETKLPDELYKIDQAVSRLENRSDIHEVNAWINPFQTYYNQNFLEEEGPTFFNMTDEVYRERMAQFLFSPHGSEYRFMFQYNDTLSCGDPVPDIELNVLKFKHIQFSDFQSERLTAMNEVKQIIEDANFSGRAFAFSKEYATWETDEVITEELYRNLLIAFGCIFFTTLLLLSNVLACMEVFISMGLTLANVAGFMHFWGLTIDTVSCTNLIISIGICVDYAAHIAHAFLWRQGTRNDRIKKALVDVGPAVLNGGISTFLSVILLANSRSHVFETFFKIFFLVVIFSMFNGLILLPVLLSFIGPETKVSQANKENAIKGQNTSEEGEGVEMEPLSSFENPSLKSKEKNGNTSDLTI